MNQHDLTELVDRFLAWPVPASVYPDGAPGQPGRTGTNLLTATEARAMLKHVLADPPDRSPAKEAGPANGEVADRFELGLDAARKGVQELFPDENRAAAIEGWEDDAKPICRFRWYEDGGDPQVGISARAYWALAADQSGTVLAQMHPEIQHDAG